MKKTLSTNQIADELRSDDNANWSYSGALALAEYLEQMEEDTGGEMELDVVAIRCDYAQWESLQEWAEDYLGDDWKDGIGLDEDSDDDDTEKAIREYIRDRGTLIEFEGGVIVDSF